MYWQFLEWVWKEDNANEQVVFFQGSCTQEEKKKMDAMRGIGQD